MPRAIQVPVVCALLLAGAGAGARADAAPAPPRDCPKDHTAHTDHGGPYCRPPPPKCPGGEQPRLAGRNNWYCEPHAPAGGCPPGSAWTSHSREEAWCAGTREACASDNMKADANCKVTALCVQEIERHRHPRSGGGTFIEERVVQACGDKGACPTGLKCVTARRYVSPKAGDGKAKK